MFILFRIRNDGIVWSYIFKYGLSYYVREVEYFFHFVFVREWYPIAGSEYFFVAIEHTGISEFKCNAVYSTYTILIIVYYTRTIFRM